MLSELRPECGKSEEGKPERASQEVRWMCGVTVPRESLPMKPEGGRFAVTKVTKCSESNSKPERFILLFS